MILEDSSVKSVVDFHFKNSRKFSENYTKSILFLKYCIVILFIGHLYVTYRRSLHDDTGTERAA